MAGGTPIRYIGGRLYRATRENRWIEELGTVSSGEMSFDADAEIAGSFSCELINPTTLRPYRDFLAPVLTVRYLDSTDEETVIEASEQMGLYTVLPPPRRVNASYERQIVAGRDLTYILAADSFAYAKSVAKGVNLVDAARSIIDSMNLRHAIPSSSAVAGSRIWWKQGASKLEVVNGLLKAAGYYRIFATRTGTLTSFPSRRLSEAEPAFTISSALGQVTGEVEIDAESGGIANRVIVVSNDPQRDPIRETRINADPDSPVSTVSLMDDDGNPLILTEYIEDNNISSASAAVALAERRLEEAASLMTRCLVRCLPDPRLSPHDVVQLMISRDDGTEVASGRWWWDEWRAGFTPDQGVMSVRCYKLLPFEMAVG